MTGIVQSVIFSKDKFTVSKAVDFLSRHHYKFNKLDKTPYSLRFRQEDPDLLRNAGYLFRTVSIADGIAFIIAYR